MRNATVTLIIAGCLAVSAGHASAQVSLGVAGGPSSPAGSLSDVVNAGIHGGVALDLGLPLIPIGMRGELMAQRLPGAGDGDAFNLVWAAANGRFDLLPVPLLSAYVTAGAGLYSSSFDADRAANGGRSTDVGLNAGIGAGLNLLVARPFIEVRYHRVAGDPARAFVPISIGVFF